MTKKAIFGLAATGAVIALGPVVKRRIGHKMREHCEEMAAKCRQMMAGRPDRVARKSARRSTLNTVMRIRWRLPRLGGRRWPWRWRRRARTVPGEPPATEPARVVHDDAQIAREAVDAALAPLREPADPRAAVIEAYARLEHVLAERERGRRTAVAPREYLRRVMREHGMPEGSLTTLTALFEEARFSRHPIPESAQRRAASELKTARAAATHASETV